jgi:hypothetical protein
MRSQANKLYREGIVFLLREYKRFALLVSGLFHVCTFTVFHKCSVTVKVYLLVVFKALKQAVSRGTELHCFAYTVNATWLAQNELTVTS